MDPKYQQWIETHVEGDPYLQCGKYTLLMRSVFPELTRVRGHVETVDGLRAHWWLTTPEGEIVDPTAAQFPVIYEYHPHDEHRPEPVGKCRECGEYVYPDSPGAPEFCSEAHHNAYLSSLGFDPVTGRNVGRVMW